MHAAQKSNILHQFKFVQVYLDTQLITHAAQSEGALYWVPTTTKHGGVLLLAYTFFVTVCIYSIHVQSLS